MSYTRLPSDPLHATASGAADFRRKVQQDAQDRAAMRETQLESQASSLKDPQERIGIWEWLHGVRLPQAAEHVLVKVIARQTRLTVAQVHEEQRRRAASAAPERA